MIRGLCCLAFLSALLPWAMDKLVLDPMSETTGFNPVKDYRALRVPDVYLADTLPSWQILFVRLF